MNVAKIAAGVLIGNLLTLFVVYLLFGFIIASRLGSYPSEAPAITSLGLNDDMSHERRCTEARRRGTPESEIPECS